MLGKELPVRIIKLRPEEFVDLPGLCRSYMLLTESKEPKYWCLKVISKMESGLFDKLKESMNAHFDHILLIPYRNQLR